MKKQEKEKSVWSVQAHPGSPPENLSYWTWGCGCMSTAGTSGLPQANRTSHWYCWWGRIWASLWLGNLFSCPQKPHSSQGLGTHCTTQTNTLWVVPVRSFLLWPGQAALCLYRGILQTTQVTGAAASPPELQPSWVSGLQLGRQPACWGMFEARPLRQTSAFNKVPQDF